MSAARRHGQHLLPRLSVSRLPAVRRSTEHARRSRRADAHAGSRLFQGGFIPYYNCIPSVTEHLQTETEEIRITRRLLWRCFDFDAAIRVSGLTHSLTYLLTILLGLLLPLLLLPI